MHPVVLGKDIGSFKKDRIAKNLFIKVVNLNPKYTDGYYNLANIYTKLDEEKKAIEKGRNGSHIKTNFTDFGAA